MAGVWLKKSTGRIFVTFTLKMSQSAAELNAVSYVLNNSQILGMNERHSSLIKYLRPFR